MNFVWLGLAAVCYGIMSRISFYGLNNDLFWSMGGWIRKYKTVDGKFLPAPDNAYYRFFKLYYKERFPLSATALVFVTDGYHLMQFIWIKFMLLAVSTTADGHTNWIVFFAGWAVWGVLFNTGFLTSWKDLKKSD